MTSARRPSRRTSRRGSTLGSPARWRSRPSPWPRLATETAGDPERVAKVIVAAAFHDLGIWPDKTFDYLPPSIRLANAYLKGTGRSDWAPEITEMMLQHHKLTPLRDGRCPLVEPFRRADLVDLSNGLVSFVLPRRFPKEVFAHWPDARFRPSNIAPRWL